MIGSLPGEPHNVQTSAGDVLALLRQLKLFPEVLVGHSFGGKVVMSMAQQFSSIGSRMPCPVQVSDLAATTPHAPSQQKDEPIATWVPHELTAGRLGNVHNASIAMAAW